jgi:hypothetical protein
MIRFSVLSALLQIPIPFQPLDLGNGVAVDDIALVVLETPGDDDQDVPFTNPDLLLDFALDPAHPGDPVKTPHPDMVCPHHQFSVGKDLAVPLVRNADPDHLFRYIPLAWLLVGQYINPLLARFWTSGFA